MTKSLSNLIKSHYIYVNDNKKIIDSDNSFHLLSGSATKVAVDEHVETDSNNGNKEFSEGLNILSMQRLVAEEEELLTNKANDLIEEAKLKAEQIIAQANEEAERIRQLASEEGKRLGYTEGVELGQNEARALEEQLREQIAMNNKELEQQVNALEPEFVKVVVHLLEHLTGVVASEHEEVITYLIHEAINGIEKCKSFTVRVSNEDYEYVCSNADRINEGLPEDYEIQFVEETDFEKSSCQIEIPNGKIIDCSLDVQLKGLITDLKMLASI